MMVRTLLPPGFRFHPTDVELVMYYLKRKVMGKKLLFEAITELNIYKFSPSDLPDKSCLKSKDLEWYFFCPREKKYASGLRMNRATEMGYWKTTGKDRPVKYNGIVVGMVRTLVFHEGSAPHGKRTDWVIHEYRIEDKSLADKEVAQDAYVLCKVFHKNGPGPKNGAQYGAFHEEDWDGDFEIPVDSLSPDGPSSIVLKLQQNQNSAPSLSIVDLGPSSGLSVSGPGPSVVWPSMDKVLLEGQNGFDVTKVVDPANISGWSLSEAGISSASHSAHDMIPDTQNDDIAHLLASFSDDGPLLLSADANNEVAHLDQGGERQKVPNFDTSDLFSGLEDLNNLANPSRGPRGGLSFSDMEFVELNDLNAPLNFSAESCEIGGVQSSGSYRPCNFSRSEHSLPGSLCTRHDIDSDLSLFEHCANYPGYPCLTDSVHLPNVLNLSDIQRNPATGMPAGNVYYCMNPPYNINLASYNQEETRNAAGKQERAFDEVAKTSYLGSVGAAGVQQREIFSRLQLLLESVPADPASAAFDGSSILAKAEVTYRLSTCTKDALSVMLEESTFVYSCLLNLHGIEFQKTLADCSKGSFLLASAFTCALMIWLVIELYCCLWICLRFSRTISCLFETLECLLFNLLLIVLFSLKFNAFPWILWSLFVWHLGCVAVSVLAALFHLVTNYVCLFACGFFLFFFL